MSNAADEPGTTARRADSERELARQQRELAAEQHHLADIEDTRVGSIRRKAAEFYIAAAEAHEQTAARIETGGDVKA